jgi:FHS family L-fucose permease-like MFS transporter
MAKKNSNVLAIVIMFFLFAMISFVTGLQNPFGVIVKSQFHATNAMSQLGNFANFIAYLFMGLPAGFILQKRGYKITSLLAVAVGFIGVTITWLSGMAGNFWVYLLGAFISGFSMCMLNTVVNPMLNTLGGGGNKGNQLIQFGGACNSLSATIVPILVGYLIGNVTADTQIADANPALYIAMGIFAAAFIIILFSKIPEPELEANAATERPKTSETVKGAFSYRHFRLGILAIFLYVGVEVGIANFANLYMTSDAVGISASVAGTVVGMYWLLMLVGRLIGGAVGGKVSSRTMMVTVCSTAIILIALGMTLGDKSMVSFPAISGLSFSMVQIPVGVVFFVLCGLCTSVMWGSIFNLAVEGLGKYTSIASGLFMMMVFGGGVLPVIQGWVADASNYIFSYIVILIAVAYLLFYALVGSRIAKKGAE